MMGLVYNNKYDWIYQEMQPMWTYEIRQDRILF